jgi:hypothetical protein
MKKMVIISLNQHQSNCHASYRIGTDTAGWENVSSFNKANFSSSLNQGKQVASYLNKISLYNIYIMS